MPFYSGAIVGTNWKVGKTIGRGGYGRVWDVVKDRKNACLKENDKASMTLFEARVLRSLSGGVGVQKLIEEGVHHGLPFVIVEKEGIALEDLGERHNNALPLPMVLTLLYKGLKGLRTLHYRHIAHRDVSPGNLLLSKRSGCKVVWIDHGLSAFFRQDGTVMEHEATEPKDYRYGSPALRSGGDFEYSDDVFGLLLSVLEFTEYSPFDKDDKISMDTVKKIAANDKDVPIPLTSLRNFISILNINNRSPTDRLPTLPPHQKLMDCLTQSSSYNPNTILN